ncbi:hypothetical protein C7S15_1626 [Burkholderia cepacia]|uniref:DUF1376 domain-containing protein n=1 Tax=Burkholderia cepacia TaxID=292 RepID=UPI00298F5D79|nr:DUF1376 domain-containing protein [Burkholderia cepacia]MDW9227059.1 hypothetical protein [Burkholderia cepacia]
MNELPNPLTPADCDLAGYRWMPLDVERVIDSDTFGLSTGDEFKTAFRLWAKSWKQVPAASLPSDDRLLAHLAGIELVTWRKRKEIALRGWILCSDGRLYHPVIAEKALEAMQRKDDHAEKEENEQSRQQRYRERRKALFELLRAHGIVLPMKTKMDELERRAASLGVTESVTGETQNVTQSVTDVTHGGVTRDASATAIEKDRTRTETVNPVVGAHAGGEPPASVRPGELSAAMREHSIEASPHDPRIIAAAERGVTPATIRAACAEAKAAKPNERIPPAYVLSIANRWLADAAQPIPAGRTPQQPRMSAAEQRNAISDRNAEAWLNGHAESDPTVIDMEP